MDYKRRLSNPEPAAPLARVPVTSCLSSRPHCAPPDLDIPKSPCLIKHDNIFIHPLLAEWSAALAAATGDIQAPPDGPRDVIARAQGEIAEGHLAAIVASSDDAIIGKDLYGIIMSWNKGAETIFGYTAEEIVGTSILRLIPADRQDEEYLTMARIKCGDTVDHFETLRRTKAGRLIEISVTSSPIRNAAGVIVGVSKIARDISERKRAEEKIRRLNLELEQRVAERTSQLTAANRELEAFGYSVSHDLRAPLRRVMGYAGLLQDDAAPVLSPDSARFLSEICKTAKHMGTLIDDLLAFSRFGKCAMQTADFDLDPLVAEIVDGFRAETKDRQICWVVHTPFKVRADRPLLRMALFNLIANAFKFTGNCLEAHIEIGGENSENETVVFVRDNGAGFAPLDAARLFGVFQRLHCADEFEGTGVGLATVQRIIHRHGGRIWAKGAVGQGATFSFSIPKTTTTSK